LIGKYIDNGLKGDVERLNKVAPHIETEVVPNAGHDLLTAQTEKVNTLILNFLQQP
jgi:pimeloyl-ACP methyl ester carboxylesterase